MKILFYSPLPFALAHGGAQIQIEQTMAALIAVGVEAEPIRWWDDRQRGDLIHYFGVAPLIHIEHARDKGIPIVMNHLFTAACNRSEAQLRRQGWLVRTILNQPFGEGIKQQLAWRSFGRCATNVVGLEAERRVLELVYGVPRERVDLVPLGLEKIYLDAGSGKRDGDYLLCAGTITRRKNSVALARLARAAQVPVLFVGKPYAETESYWQEFRALVDGRWVRHQAHVADPAAMVALLQSARGAVVMSDYENWCLTAHEAAACGVPVLLPDQNWSRERFGNKAHYFDRIGFSPRNVEILKQFYTAAPGLPAPAVQLFSWADAAVRLKTVYERVLKQAG
ncbi:MAG TPA: glycosyltransferase [Verrucomicrobiae bacterium]|nr:glycosyltransferase [Verrucomicrobiae bacterium]